MDALKIYIDRLKNDATEELDIEIEPAHFGISEKELQLSASVKIKGSAYRSSEHLIVSLGLSTSVLSPCIVCNALFPTIIEIHSLTLSIPLSEISNSIYDLTNEIRSQILLKAPSYAECNKGTCPERTGLNPYLNQGNHFPFSELS